MKHPNLHVVILAAGRGTRMRSSQPKVLQPLGGRPMLAHVLDTAQALSPAERALVDDALATAGARRFTR